MSNVLPNADSRIFSSKLKLEDLLHLDAFTRHRMPGKKVPIAKGKGHFISPFKGQGMEFEETRHYVMGDEMRHIDWRVTARTGKPHTKVFRDDRDRQIYSFVDLSASMFFGTSVTFKSVVAIQCAAYLTWLHFHAGHRFGTFYLSETKRLHTLEGCYRNDLIKIFNFWVERNNLRQPFLSDLKEIHQALHIAKKTKFKLYLLSDFSNLESLKYFLKDIRNIASVTLLFFYDKLEKELPSPNIYKITDGNRILRFDSKDSKLNEDYHHQFNDKVIQLQEFAKKYNCHLKSISTQDDITKINLSELF